MATGLRYLDRGNVFPASESRRCRAAATPGWHRIATTRKKAKPALLTYKLARCPLRIPELAPRALKASPRFLLPQRRPPPPVQSR